MVRRFSLFAAALGLAACQPAIESIDSEGSDCVLPGTCDAEEVVPEVEEPGWRDKQSKKVIDGDPDWPVDAWTRLPKGMAAPTVENLEGLVVVLFCFQSW